MDELPQPSSFSIGPGRSRFALGRAAAQFALMASIALWLAQRGILDAWRAPGPVSLLFDVAVTLFFAAAGVSFMMLTLTYIHAFAVADRPYLAVSDDGLLVRHVARPIAWADIDRAFVQRRPGRAWLEVWLAKDSRYYRRFWPFSRAVVLRLFVPEPDATAGMIRAHPAFRGERIAG
jgi:hypothetical protein